MRKIRTKTILIVLVLLVFMSSSIIAHGVSLQAAGDLGEPGFSLSYVETFGVTGEPYVFRNNHINHPMGLFVSDDALYVAEQNGSRVMKFDTDTNDFEMQFGENGQPWHHDHFLYRPSGVTVDANGHVWVVMSHAIKEFAPDGTILQSYPDDEQWEWGNANDRFDEPHQAIFNQAGDQLFVSDRYNNRIQVFELGVDNTLTHAQTITGDFDQPHGIAFDSSGDLFVANYAIHQIHRCVLDGGVWVCANFLGSEEGNELDKLSFPVGVYIDTTDTADQLFVADSGNRRILKCTIDPTDCVVFAENPGADENYELTFLTGISGDDDGNIYVSDKDNHRVQVFNASGTHVKTYGVTRKPYETDDVHMNKPIGIAIGADNSMYVTELRGHRLIKMDADGSQSWTVGEPGIYGDDDTHFGTFWAYMQGKPAVSADHKVYVADSPNNRI
jgi:sugar lactone lactonase YvrE